MWKSQTVLTYSTYGFFPRTPAIDPDRSGLDRFLAR